MSYVIGVDCGTSGTKTVLFDEKCNVISSKTNEYPMIQPQNGYAEQDPADWRNAMIETIKAVVASSGVDKNEIVGIGLSGQMHGLVMLDANNDVIRNSIIWCDQRTGKQVEWMNEHVGNDKLVQITANPALTGWTAAKILWVKDNEPKNFEKVKHIMLPKDYLRFVLTGEYATEVSDASGMQILDVPNRDWSSELLSAFEIDRDWLGDVYESCEVTGKLTAAMANELGLNEGTIVVGGAGDNAAAAVGTGVVEDGKAFTTIGTSGVVFAHTTKAQIDKLGRVHTCCAAVPNCWHVMGVTQAAGLSLQWFRNNFCQDIIAQAENEGCDPYDILNKKAAEIPIGSDNLLYLPYLMGERTPHLDPDCRGAFIGLSAIHTRWNLLRAVMEGVTFSLRDCVEVFREMGININDMMACGGGGKSELWRSMLADTYNCEVKTLTSEEGPALGVAILALVGAGVYSTVNEACSNVVSVGSVQGPNADNISKYEKIYQDYKKLYPRLYK